MVSEAIHGLRRGNFGGEGREGVKAGVGIDGRPNQQKPFEGGSVNN